MTKTNEINISKNGEILIVSFSPTLIDKEYRKILRLKRMLHGNLSDDTLRVNFSTHIFSKLIKLLKQNFGSEYTLNIDKELTKDWEDITKQHNDFTEFSNHARDIRNNKYVADDYTDFQSTADKLKRPLKNHQLLAAYHLAFSKNANNFSVPGSGKTATVLAAYNYLKHKMYVNKIIIVSPLAAFQAWQDEYAKCFDRLPISLELYGKTNLTKEKVEQMIFPQDTRVEMILLNYSSLKRYSETVTSFMKIHDSMLVLDEAHKIKKVGGGEWSSNALKLAPFAKSRVILTGTPAPNSYADLTNLYEFIWPDKNIVGFSPQQLKIYSENTDKYYTQIETLIKRLEPFYIRVTKENLKLAPPTFHEPKQIEMDNNQEKIYTSLEEAYDMPRLLDDYSHNRALLTSKLIRLRQAASHPKLLTKSLKDYYENVDDYNQNQYELNDDLMVGTDIVKMITEYNQIPNKYIELSRLLESILKDGGRAIVWCEFIFTINELSTFLNSRRINHRLLYGEVLNDERVKIIREFQKPNARFSVIIANPHAVGESISIHQYCHNAIYFEMGYNAATYMQSKDRIHRVGLPDNTKTEYHYLVSKNTIESSIVMRVVEKEEKMLSIVEKNKIPLIENNIDFLEDNEDDLKKLIKDYYERHSLV